MNDRLEECLCNWARWMRGSTAVRGLPTKSTVLQSGGASQSFDDMCEDLDEWLARTTDTAIADLPEDQRCAVHHRYLLAVFRFRDYTSALERAHVAVRKALQSKNVYLDVGG